MYIKKFAIFKNISKLHTKVNMRLRKNKASQGLSRSVRKNFTNNNKNEVTRHQKYLHRLDEAK